MHSVPGLKTPNDTGGAAAVERLLDTYGNEVLRISYLYLKDRHLAEDALQEVFSRIYLKLPGFRGESSERTWITRITINVCKDMLRNAWLKKVLPLPAIKSPDRNKAVEEAVVAADENRRLFEAVLSLPTAFREVIILYYYQGCDTREASKILRIAEGTVRSRLHRARELLKIRLDGRVDFAE